MKRACFYRNTNLRENQDIRVPLLQAGQAIQQFKNNLFTDEKEQNKPYKDCLDAYGV